MPPIQSERRKNIDKYLTMTVYNLQIVQIYTNSRAQSKQQIFGMLVKRIHLSPLHMHVRLDTNQGYDLTFAFIKTFLQNHSLEFRMKEFRFCLTEKQSKEGKCDRRRRQFISRCFNWNAI